MKKALLIFFLVVDHVLAGTRLDDAKGAAEVYFKAVTRFDAEALVAVFHPEVQRQIADIAIVSLSELTNPGLLKSVLWEMEVESLDQLRALPAEKIATKFYNAYLQHAFTARTRSMAKSMKLEILAATEEKEIIYLVYTFTSDAQGAPPPTPQVILFKMVDGAPRLSLTTQISEFQMWVLRLKRGSPGQ
jgi:hypothetical protein